MILWLWLTDGAACRPRRAFNLLSTTAVRVKAEFLFRRGFGPGTVFILGTGNTPFAGFKALVSSFGAGRPACFLNASKIAPRGSLLVQILLLSGHDGGYETGSDRGAAGGSFSAVDREAAFILAIDQGFGLYPTVS
jgi:hypothetical protein